MASLTDIKIKRAKEGFLADDSHPGLRLRVGKTRRVWLYRYRDKHTGKLIEVSIGRYPQNPQAPQPSEMTLAEARLKHSELRIVRDKGGDVRKALELKTDGVFTVKKLCNLFIDDYARAHKRSWHEDARMLEKDVIPKWGDRPVSEIQRDPDVYGLISPVIERGERGAQLLLACCR